MLWQISGASMNWTIVNLNYLLYDQQLLRHNVVESIDWSVTRQRGDFTVEKHGTVNLQASGDTFIPYEDITESTAITWAQNALGSTAIAQLETDMDAELALLNTPTHGFGVPWTDSGI